MARKTLAELITKIAALLADNINGEISEADLRELYTDFKDSFAHLDDYDAFVTATIAALATKADDAATTAALATKMEASDIENKQDIAAAALTGTALAFTKTAVYGSFASPESGNFTGIFTGAKLGITVRVWHSAAGEPTYPGTFKKLQTSRAYSNSAMNIYKFVYMSANRVIFSIDQEI